MQDSPPASVRDASFKRARYEGGPTAAHHFEIAVPATFRPAEAAGDVDPGQARWPSSPFVPIAKFVDAQDPGFQLEVGLAELSRDVNAGDFGELDAAARGSRVVQRRDADTWLGCHSEMIAHGGSVDAPAVERIRMLKDGSRLFRVACVSPEAAYDARAEEIARSVHSFRVLAPTGEASAEPIRTHRTRERSGWSFGVPAFWSRSDPVPSDASALLRPSASHQYDLWTEVCELTESASLESGLRGYAAVMRSRGLRLVGAPICAASPPRGFDELRYYSPPARARGLDHHVTVMALRRADRSVLCAVCGPSRHAAAWGWALCKRSAETVVRTLSPDPAC